MVGPGWSSTGEKMAAEARGDLLCTFLGSKKVKGERVGKKNIFGGHGIYIYRKSVDVLYESTFILYLVEIYFVYCKSVI